MAGLIASEHAANGHDPDLCAVCDTIGGIRERAGLVGQEEAAPEPSFEAQLEESGAKWFPCDGGDCGYVEPEDGSPSEHFEVPRRGLVALAFASAHREECEGSRTALVHNGLEVPPGVAEQLRLVGATIKFGGAHWGVSQGNTFLGNIHCDDDWRAVVRIAQARDNRPTLAEWAAANGGEEAAVLAECEKRGLSFEYVHGAPAPCGIGGDSSDPWDFFTTWPAALSAACQAARVPTPFKPDKDADEWQPPETVHDVLNYLRSRNYSLITDGEAVLDALQECSRQVHAHEEVARDDTPAE